MGENEVCSEHRECMLRIRNLEDGVKQWEERFHGYKEYLNRQIEDLDGKIAQTNKDFSILDKTMTEIKIMFTQIENKLNELAENKKDTKTKVLYPLFVGVILSLSSGLIGFILSKVMR